MRHKNRTVRGDELRRKHQDTYEKWWLGKKVTEIIGGGRFDPPITITKVEYIGNSVYGVVRLTDNNGNQYYPSSNGMRPPKYNVSVV